MTAEGERLNRYLARRGIASRRSADTLIADGRVTVNGRPGTVGSVVDPATDEVVVDGQQVADAPAHVVLALHKPADVVTTRHDPQGRRTVMDLVEPLPGLVPVGRLDADSRGLLLLTTDGELAHRATHPRYGLRKRYRVTADGPIRREHLDALLRGIRLDDGIARAAAVEPAPRPEEAVVVMAEGRKREVRRMFAALGLTVTDLLREAVGPISLGTLPEGAARRLSPDEERALRQALGLGPAVVTVDGPAGSGKTTLGRALALRLGLPLVDTGLLYRAVTIAASRAGIDAADAAALGALAARLDIRPDVDPAAAEAGVTLDGAHLDERTLHDPALAPLLAAVSATPAVRQALLAPQRALAAHGAVAVGRDCGTVVFPEAAVKLFLDAAPEVRAERRARQLDRRGAGVTQAVLEREVAERDSRDERRADAPLRRADDAHAIDTGAHGIDEVLQEALRLCAAAGLTA